MYLASKEIIPPKEYRHDKKLMNSDEETV